MEKFGVSSLVLYMEVCNTDFAIMLQQSFNIFVFVALTNFVTQQLFSAACKFWRCKCEGLKPWNEITHSFGDVKNFRHHKCYMYRENSEIKVIFLKKW